MKTMVRCRSLDMTALAAQEAHGKREDYTSKKRKVREAAPIVAHGLDLRALYDAHMDGVRQNSAAKRPVLHFIVRFPPELLDVDAKHFTGDKRKRQRMMLQQAVAFIERTHGGDAVFAARLDRDEAGETIADVFAAPRYEKRTKRTKADEKGVIWASATKFGKELAEKHQDEIQRRHPKAKGKLSAPRHVGIALNIEWRDWFERVNEVKLAKKNEKASAAPDRLETEAFKAVQDERDRLEREVKALAIREAVQERVEAEQDARQAKLDELESRLRTVYTRVQSLVGIVADRLGVGPTLSAIASVIRQHNEPDDFDPYDGPEH
jgi:hypothetical protein